jgi:DUF4097 and DUF4098 domain-containing protein YvlB
MASVPPPYSGQPSWREGRRAQKDAYRAQRSAWQAQRQYWRAMRRPSLVRPILWIAFGVTALLLTTGHIGGVVFWEWYVRWWPILLIGIGLLLLGEWWLNRDSPYVRTGGSGIAALIVLLAVLGAVAHGLRDAGPHVFNFGANGWDEGWRFFGHEHDADKQVDTAVPADVFLHVQNPRGDVVVTASPDGQLHVISHDVVYAHDSRAADQQLEQLAPRMEVNGREATLTTNALERGSADLAIQTPPGASLDIQARHGDVSVDGLHGTVHVQSGNGDVKLTDLPSPATVEMSKGDFSARGLGGTLTLTGRMDDVTVTASTARVQMSGDFFGDVSLSEISAPVSIRSTRTTFEAERVPGAISLDSGDLHVSRSSAPLRITTRAKDVSLAGVAGGPVTVEDSDGDISLTPGLPAGDINLHNQNGDIEVTLPENGMYQVQATAPNGDISTEWGQGGDDEHSLSVRAGTGSGKTVTVKLAADHGDIQIKKGPPAEAESDAPANARHLRPPSGAPVETTQE